MVRIATEDDAEALVRLINAAFVVERSFIDVDRVRLDEVRELQRRGAFLLHGDMEAGVYVELCNGRGYFGLLSVAPALQGSGLGRRMVEAAERYCLDRGCEWMDIRVVNAREELPPFYRKLGYAECGTEPFVSEFPTKFPVHLVKMEKRLDSKKGLAADERG